MNGYIIGIDIGTGSTKAVALDTNGKVIGSTQQSYLLIQSVDSKEEQDPDILLNACFSCIKNLILQLKQLPMCVSLSSAMHGIMAVDKDGQPITNLIVWSDNRSSEIAQKLRNDKTGQSIYLSTGTPIHAMSPLCKIIWWRENDAEIFTKAHKYISIKEYLWYRFFNEYIIDHSIASATGLFNIDTLDWNPDSLQISHISAKQLSTPVPTNHCKQGISKEACQLTGLTDSIPVCIGASDGCLANLGSNALKTGIAAITIGTSGAVRIASKIPIRNIRSMIFNYILDSQYFICGGPINNGGNIMEWLIRNFLDIEDKNVDPYSRIFDMIQQIPAGSEGLIFLPYIFAERAPIWDEESTGVFMGIRNIHTKAHFIRAIIEGICYALKNVLESIEIATCEVNEIHASGGFIKSEGWMQLLADVTGKTIVIIETDDASAIGAAIMAFKSLGIIEDFNETKRKSRVLRPNKGYIDKYSKYYKVYKTIYPNLQESMHLLYETIN
jgi:gluconokinase